MGLTNVLIPLYWLTEKLSENLVNTAACSFEYTRGISDDAYDDEFIQSEGSTSPMIYLHHHDNSS
jgi:hypothetical protein